MPRCALPNDDAVIARVLESLPVAGPDRAATIVDLGGGTGVYAVPLAQAGHRVEVLDQSADALATLARRAQAAGVSDRVRGRAADLDSLDGALPGGGSDLVLCHRVLEYVVDPASTLRAARDALRPDGQLSILVVSRAGAVLSHLLAGRFDEADTMLAAASGVRRHFDLGELQALLHDAGFQPAATAGIGLIGELAPALAEQASYSLQVRIGAAAEFQSVAPLLHVIARASAATV